MFNQDDLLKENLYLLKENISDDIVGYIIKIRFLSLNSA